MTTRKFTAAIDWAAEQLMADDERIVYFGEDVAMLHPPLYGRFGADRVMNAPISESAFVGAAVGAAMTGLRPIVEVMLVDFMGVAMDAVLNHMAKLEALSGGSWKCPLVVRSACGGGYGDGGQHEQALWGLLAGIPGLCVVVPSTPADAAGLLASAVFEDGPVIFLEHKLLSETWLEFMGRGGRESVGFDVPADGVEGDVPDPLVRTKLGTAVTRREGNDVTIASLGVGVHRSLAAAAALAEDGIECEVIDLRTVRPLDRHGLATSVEKTRRLVVVDEDYEQFGLSGELAATLLEQRLQFDFARVCTRHTLPYARHLEDAALPNVQRIIEGVTACVRAG